MGILVDVNLHEETGLYYLEIITQPYAVPISLRGRYYYRSGSTKQELIGAALTDYLLRTVVRHGMKLLSPQLPLMILTMPV